MESVIPKSTEPTLAECEQIVIQGMQQTEKVAAALLAIHERKLYRENFHSFEEYLHKRLHLSRSRAYQLIQFAKLKRQNMASNTSGPQNERQARNLAADGTAGRPGSQSPPVSRVVRYVLDAVSRRPAEERRQFMQQLREALLKLEQELEMPMHCGPTAPQPPVAPNQKQVIDHTQLIVENEIPQPPFNKLRLH